MNLTAERIYQLGLVDGVISEPLGGAHRNYDLVAETMKQTFVQQLQQLQSLPMDQLLSQRYKRLMSYGIHQ